MFIATATAICSLGYGLRLNAVPRSSGSVDTAEQHFGVAKPSTSYCWGKGGNVTSAAWQVTLCDPIRHASSRKAARPGCLPERGTERICCCGSVLLRSWPCSNPSEYLLYPRAHSSKPAAPPPYARMLGQRY